MSQVTVIATIRALEGHEEAVLDSLKQLLAPTRAEEGCLNYDLHRDLEDPGCFCFHENWESQAHLDRHLKTDHIAANRARIQDKIESLVVQRLERV